MNKYKQCSSDSPAVRAERMPEAARVFAQRIARKFYGRNADVRTCNENSHSQDGSYAEYSAFIGITRNNATTGHNVSFSVERVS